MYVSTSIERDNANDKNLIIIYAFNNTLSFPFRVIPLHMVVFTSLNEVVKCLGVILGITGSFLHV